MDCVWSWRPESSSYDKDKCTIKKRGWYLMGDTCFNIKLLGIPMAWDKISTDFVMVIHRIVLFVSMCSRYFFSVEIYFLVPLAISKWRLIKYFKGRHYKTMYKFLPWNYLVTRCPKTNLSWCILQINCFEKLSNASWRWLSSTNYIQVMKICM